MQGADTQKSGNVVSLFNSRDKSKAADVEAAGDEGKVAGEGSFKDIMDRNAKNKERIEKERLNANKSVLRSYRIKN